ncbi:periplasmic pilin chaperone [Escherichia coli]|nr:periplasmic pilin chaperone [Escherichia coli]GCR74351.1 periplasmic pilin chaperone [Escherichia coli]
MTFMKGLPLLLLVASLCSHAALQPDRTRIVFNANDKATSLRVDNRSDKLPYLAYSWLENEKGRKAMIFWLPCHRYNVWNRKQQRRCG